MKKTLILLLMPVLFFLSCCKDDETVLDVHFRLEYDGEPLVLFEDETYPNGMEMFFTKFSFFISDLRIGDQAVGQTQLIDLTADHSTLERAQDGYTLTFVNLTPGEVHEIFFNIGLTPEVNATSPADYASSNDLSIGSEYWSPWSSYIFSKTEAKIDEDGDGIKELNVALHLGLNDAFRTVSLQDGFSITENEINRVDIVFDLKRYFESPDGIYDVLAVPQIHQTNTIDEINELADNLVASIRME